MFENVTTIARLIADRLIDSGAQAVILMGSHTRGESHPYSDVDLLALGDGPPHSLEREEDHLIALKWQTVDSVRAQFDDPHAVGRMIPAWRNAVILRDVNGVAAGIQEEARAWTWDRIKDRIDAQIAADITHYAENVHKLLGALNQNQPYKATVERNTLAVSMAAIMTLRLRILYGTENRLWDLVARRLGPVWVETQDAAFGLNEQPFAETCNAALKLYAITAREVLPLLEDGQRSVVMYATQIAGHPLDQMPALEAS